MAQIITMIDYELYAKVQPTELLNQAWNDRKLKWRAVRDGVGVLVCMCYCDARLAQHTAVAAGDGGALDGSVLLGGHGRAVAGAQCVAVTCDVS
jgi:hypothetical protein